MKIPVFPGGFRAVTDYLFSEFSGQHNGRQDFVQAGRCRGPGHCLNAFGAQGANAALVIAAAYIIKVQSAAWYVKFTDTIFGPPPEEATA
jgi:hypothetical protein